MHNNQLLCEAGSDASHCRMLNTQQRYTKTERIRVQWLCVSSVVQITFVDTDQLCSLTSADLKSCRDTSESHHQAGSRWETKLQLFFVVSFIGVTRGCRSRCVLPPPGSCFSLERKHSRLRGNTPTRLGRKSTSNPAILSDLKPLTCSRGNMEETPLSSPHLLCGRRRRSFLSWVTQTTTETLQLLDSHSVIHMNSHLQTESK